MRFLGFCIFEEIIRLGLYMYSGRNGGYDFRLVSICFYLFLCICLLYVFYRGRIFVFLLNYFFYVNFDVFLCFNFFL